MGTSAAAVGDAGTDTTSLSSELHVSLMTSGGAQLTICKNEWFLL